MKSIIYIEEDMVLWVEETTEEQLQKVLPNPPYNNDDDWGNPYAMLMRKKDARRAKGVNAVVLVKDGTREDFMYKNYDAVSGSFATTDNETRLKQVRTGHPHYRVPALLKNLVPTGTQYKRMKAASVAAGLEALFTRCFGKITNSDVLDEVDVDLIEANLQIFDEDVRKLVIMQVASNISNKSETISKEKKIAWWNKLKGTNYEVHGLSAIAGIHSRHGDHDEAVKVYDNLKKRVNGKIGEEIERKIHVIGRGHEEVRKLRRIKREIDTLRKEIVDVTREAIEAQQSVNIGNRLVDMKTKAKEALDIIKDIKVRASGKVLEEAMLPLTTWEAEFRALTKEGDNG
jgi:hypothetical protein